MYPYIQIILPSYTLMALIGGFAVLCLVYMRLNKYEIDFATFLFLFFFCVLGGFAGSKLLFALTQIPWLVSNFSPMNLVMLIPQSGYVFYGGLFGVIAAMMIMTRRDREMRRRVFQMTAPAMPLFHMFGRIGCFLSGCCYGKKLVHPVEIGPFVLYRIPVQLLEALAELILFVVLMVLERKKKETDLLKTYLILYAIIRFLDEFLRGDSIRGLLFGISTAQYISLAIVVYYGCIFLRKKEKE